MRNATEYLYYYVFRSRDKGKTWANITYNLDLSLSEATCFMQREKVRHPSDWLRLVRLESNVVMEYKGDSNALHKFAERQKCIVKIIADNGRWGYLGLTTVPDKNKYDLFPTLATPFSTQREAAEAVNRYWAERNTFGKAEYLLVNEEMESLPQDEAQTNGGKQ